MDSHSVNDFEPDVLNLFYSVLYLLINAESDVLPKPMILKSIALKRFEGLWIADLYMKNMPHVIFYII